MDWCFYRGTWSSSDTKWRNKSMLWDFNQLQYWLLVSRSEATLQKLWPIWRTSAEKWEVLSSPRATPPGKTLGAPHPRFGPQSCDPHAAPLVPPQVDPTLRWGWTPSKARGGVFRVLASAWAFTVFCSSIQGSAFSSYAEYGGELEKPRDFRFLDIGKPPWT